MMAFVIIASCIMMPSISGFNSCGDDEILDLINLCAHLQKHLIEIGFENVSVTPQDDETIAVSYENRLYRNEMTALGIVLREAFQSLSEIKRIRVEIKRLGVPIIAFTIASNDLDLCARDRITASEFGRRIEFSPPREIAGVFATVQPLPVLNPSFRKVEIILEPVVSANLGNRDDPYKFKFDLRPGLSTVLTRGLNLQFSLSIPIMDEINFNKESLRLYSATVSYLNLLGRRTFLSNHIGYFAGERYGISSQAAHYLLDGNLAFIGRADYTGFLYYDDRMWFYSPLKLWTYNLGVQWQFSPYAMHASIQYGRYQLGDRGFRVAIGRYLRETRLDFFGLATTGDRWVGFEMALPLFPNKRLPPHRLRLNYPELYVVKYNYIASDWGKTFAIPNDLLEFRGDLTENYIRSHLQELRPLLNGAGQRWTHEQNR